MPRTSADFYLLILNWAHVGGMTHFRLGVGNVDRRDLGFLRLLRSLPPALSPSFSVSPLVPNREVMQKSLISSTLSTGKSVDGKKKRDIKQNTFFSSSSSFIVRGLEMSIITVC